MLCFFVFLVIAVVGNWLYVEFGKGSLDKSLFTLGKFDISIYAILQVAAFVSFQALRFAITDEHPHIFY